MVFDESNPDPLARNWLTMGSSGRPAGDGYAELRAIPRNTALTPPLTAHEGGMGTSTSPFALLTAEQLADALSVSPRTLEAWRRRAEGPPWVDLGGRVRYRVLAVDEWLASREHHPGAA